MVYYGRKINLPRVCHQRSKGNNPKSEDFVIMKYNVSLEFTVDTSDYDDVRRREDVVGLVQDMVRGYADFPEIRIVVNHVVVVEQWSSINEKHQ